MQTIAQMRVVCVGIGLVARQITLYARKRIREICYRCLKVCYIVFRRREIGAQIIYGTQAYRDGVLRRC